MDRNQIIGFSLLAVLLIGYIVYNNSAQKNNQELKKQQKTQDSLAQVKARQQQPGTDSAAGPTPADTLSDSMRRMLPPGMNGTAQELTLENKDLSLRFTTKGAHPTAALLKDYTTYDKKPLYLFNGAGNELSLVLPYDNGRSTNALYFTPVTSKGPQGQQIVDFASDLGNGRKVDIIYTLPAEGYMLSVDVRLTGMSTASSNLSWTMRSQHTEKVLTDERNNSQIYYRYKNGDNDYFTIREEKRKTLDDNLQWVGFRMHYFSSALIADKGFGKSELVANSQLPDSGIVAQQRTTFSLPFSNNEASLQWYIGPNHYRTLKSYDLGLQEMVPLGYGLFFFVKYINMWIIIPLFNFLSGFIGNMGIIIMLLTIFIRLILSFFTYKSYLSAAKMRVLKPEIDELRAQFGDDQQRMGMEQMKLYRSAGVNPLGGCLPTLFQIPILFAMYYFFPSSIELRQKSFLWADDLSTYDSILNLGFNIPFYGDHISLFTLLMTASSLFLALYNRNMTAQDPNNPMLKWLPFIFPIMLLGVFNKMAAALTFYYFFSNMISIVQQWVIQKFIIDEKKIHAQIQENRNKPATPSKWQQRLEEMQKAQAERMKQQPRKK